MDSSDCFANQGSRCRILTKMLCSTKKCSFYKTKQQYASDLEKYPPDAYGERYKLKNKGEVKSK